MPRLRNLALVTLCLLSPRADAADEDPVVVRVGPASMRASDVTRRLAALPPYQLRGLGGTPDEIRHRFIDTVIVPEMLFGNEAEQRGLAKTPAGQSRIREVERRALAESLRRDALAAGVPEGEIRAYYDSHRGDYEKPERFRLSRILVEDEALAKRIAADARGAGGPERWSKLAREHSVDAATKMRNGMLGFVLPDGHTDSPQVAVDPALYAAAAKVKDGEIVPQPVKEGARFAVIWRRGTLPKVDRSFKEEHDNIRDLLIRERVDRAVSELTTNLRKERVKDENPAALDSLPPEQTPGGPRPRPVVAPPGSADPRPRPGERGLR